LKLIKKENCILLVSIKQVYHDAKPTERKKKITGYFKRHMTLQLS